MSTSILSNLDFNNAAKIINLPDGVNDQDPATVAQLKSAIEGLAWKDNVRVSATSNINIASPGETIDSIPLSSADRVLLMSQTDQKQNGIYVWNGGTVAMTRSLDANSSSDLSQAIVTVDGGTNAGATFRQSTVNPVIGTDDIVFASFGVVAPSATENTRGIAELATQAEVNAGTDDATIVTPLKLKNWSGRTLKYSTLIGDGTATQYTVTHNLGSRDVHVTVYRNSGNYDKVLCDVAMATVNTVQLNFASAPTSNQFKVVVSA